MNLIQIFWSSEKKFNTCQERAVRLFSVTSLRSIDNQTNERKSLRLKENEANQDTFFHFRFKLEKFQSRKREKTQTTFSPFLL